MNRDRFITYIDSPGNLDKGNLEEIRGILDEYPYFQTAHMLFVKTLSNLQDVRFSNQLKFSAAHIGNRHILFNLVNQPGVTVSPQTGPPGSTERESLPVQDREDVNESLADKVMKDIEDLKRSKARASETEEVDDDGLSPEISGPLKPASGEAGEKTPEDTGDNEDKAGQEIRDVFVIDEKADIEKAPGRQPHASAGSVHDEVVEDMSKEADQELLELDKPASLSGTDDKTGDSDREQKKEVSEKKNASPAAELKSESHSFARWIDMFQFGQPVLAEERERQTPLSDSSSGAVNEDNDGDENDRAGINLIDKFLREKPRIEPRSPLEDEPPPADMSEKSTRESDEFFTETLARIYVQQKHYRKAIYAYEKLCLKYPEKYSYFADRIDEIKRMDNH